MTAKPAVIRIVVPLLSILILVLALQNRSIKAEYSQLLDQNRWLQVGSHVPRFTAAAQDGSPVTVGEGETGKRQLLFMMSAKCSFCSASVPAWQKIAQRLSGSSEVEVVGVSLDSAHVMRGYVREHNLQFPVVNFPAPKFMDFYRVTAVPQVVLLDHEGRVEYLRKGSLTAAIAVDSVLTILDLKGGAAGRLP